ncbi:MAG: hypothetical protein JXJ18_03355 [Rhodobacteraceae bacterium]|nr:hypothetical protein [Paracoccaceae bacterium]
MSEDIATLRVSMMRRLTGLAVMFLLGGLLLYIAMARPPAELGWRVFLLALGGVTLTLAEAMRRATARTLHLTEEGLFDSDGQVLARIEDIREIERGLFALKPSNGFTLKLKSAAPRAWAPGVWWRLGRRLGVGGVTSAAQAKAMAEIMTAMLVTRQHADQTQD